MQANIATSLDDGNKKSTAVSWSARDVESVESNLNRHPGPVKQRRLRSWSLAGEGLSARLAAAELI